METTFYFILVPLTVINAVLAYVLYSKISAFDEIFSSIYLNREQINAIDNRLSSIEGEMEDFSDWDVTLNDGLEDEDEEASESWEEDIEDSLKSIELRFNNHVNSVNEMMAFLDRMVGRLDQIEQHLRDNRTNL